MIIVAIQDGDRKKKVSKGSRDIFYTNNLSSASDRSYCDLTNSEIKVLQSDVKSLTEIVNIFMSNVQIYKQITPDR